MRNHYEDALKRIAEKFRRTAETAAEEGIIPYQSAEGKWIVSPYDGNSWWTGGFWPGLMWQLWKLTGDGFFLTEARRAEKLLTDEFRTFRKLNHDVGFMYLLSCGADAKLTGDEQAETDLLHAASLLMGRFNPAGFIRAWNEPERTGYAIIDCMMNLPLLYWATDETGDPRFREIAVAHADTAARTFIRDDGSVNHILRFDPFTGELIESIGGQGYGVGSSWTRGQAWALYGFVLSYIHTKDEKYLGTARRVAHYFISNIPESGLIPVDFRQPEEPAWEDSTAAAIASCGLIELARAVGGRDADVYMKAAMKLLKTLDEKRCAWDPEIDHLLEKCTAAYHDPAHEFAIIYGDYYFLEAVMKLTGKELFIW